MLSSGRKKKKKSKRKTIFFPFFQHCFPAFSRPFSCEGVKRFLLNLSRVLGLSPNSQLCPVGVAGGSWSLSAAPPRVQLQTTAVSKSAALREKPSVWCNFWGEFLWKHPFLFFFFYCVFNFVFLSVLQFNDAKASQTKKKKKESGVFLCSHDACLLPRLPPKSVWKQTQLLIVLQRRCQSRRS